MPLPTPAADAAPAEYLAVLRRHRRRVAPFARGPTRLRESIDTATSPRRQICGREARLPAAGNVAAIAAALSRVDPAAMRPDSAPGLAVRRRNALTASECPTGRSRHPSNRAHARTTVARSPASARGGDSTPPLPACAGKSRGRCISVPGQRRQPSPPVACPASAQSRLIQLQTRLAAACRSACWSARPWVLVRRVQWGSAIAQPRVRHAGDLATHWRDGHDSGSTGFARTAWWRYLIPS